MEVFNQILNQIKIILASQGIPEAYHGLISLGIVYLVVIIVVVFILFVLLAVSKSAKKAEIDENVGEGGVGNVGDDNEKVASESPTQVDVTPPETDVSSVAESTEVAESPEIATIDESVTVEVASSDSRSDHAAVDQSLVEKSDESPAGLFGRLKQGLGKTRDALIGRIDDLFSTHGTIDADLLEELEEILITADVGLATTRRLVESLEEKLARDELKDVAALKQGLIGEMMQILSVDVAPLDTTIASPFVMIVVGVNGVGKTTTIGKLAKRYTDEGKRVILGAGDTFRAAAADQLAIWGERAGVDVIKHNDGADPGAVAFDAVKAAVARKADILILDTAGRLHNKVHLMDELKKIKRVIARELPEAPHETLLVLDATTGQNALIQAKTFSEVVDLTGIVMTKLDGTAKGGIVAAICNELNLPIRFIGVGEAAEDLREFDSKQFISALFEVD